MSHLARLARAARYIYPRYESGIGRRRRPFYEVEYLMLIDFITNFSQNV